MQLIAKRPHDMHLILSLCVAEVLTMAGVFAFPALLPTFVDEWGLSRRRKRGGSPASTSAAYAVTAPPVLALTDRLDARWVYFGGALLAAAAAAGFALFARASGRRCCSARWPARRSQRPTCPACAC